MPDRNGVRTFRDPALEPPGLDECLAKIEVHLYHQNWQLAMSTIIAYRKKVLLKAKQLSLEERLSMGIGELDLDQRAMEACEDKGEVYYVRELVKLTPHNIFGWENVGPGTVRRIQIALGRIGLALKGTEVVKDGTDEGGHLRIHAATEAAATASRSCQARDESRGAWAGRAALRDT